MALAEPGKTSEVVTPPATVSAYESSWVLSASSDLSHGKIGPLCEFVSAAPFRPGLDISPI